MSAAANLDLHRDVVRGLVQYLRWLDVHPDGGNLSDVISAAWAGIDNDDAEDYVFEFIKDGSASPEYIAQARQGDYRELWALANDYLASFEHPEVAWDKSVAEALAAVLDPSVVPAALGPRSRPSPLAERQAGPRR